MLSIVQLRNEKSNSISSQKSAPHTTSHTILLAVKLTVIYCDAKRSMFLAVEKDKNNLLKLLLLVIKMNMNCL